MSSWITSSLGDAAHVGGKAASLGRLLRLGRPVPPAFVVKDALFRHLLGQASEEDDLALLAARLGAAAWPRSFPETLEAALAALGGTRFAVRSSFALEDDPQALAAGVFTSCVDVSAAEVPAAVRTVLASAVSPAARAYARSRSRRMLTAPVAVLVHPFRPAHAAGHVACGSGQAAHTWVQHGQLDDETQATLAREALAIAATLGPSELEWLLDAGGITWLQWRPFVPPRREPWVPTEGETAPHARQPLDPVSAGWVWDASHNPEPLSAAQAGLVALADAQAHPGYDQRVIGGYLFYRPAAPSAAPPLSVADAEALVDSLCGHLDEAWLRWQGAPPLEAALTTWLAGYEPLLGQVGRVVREGRQALARFVAAHLPAHQAELPRLLGGVPSKATRRAALWRALRGAGNEEAEAHALSCLLGEFGDEPAAWDVAAPTLRETLAHPRLPRPEAPAPPQEASSRDVTLEALTQMLPAPDVALLRAHVDHARRCVALGEADDWLYARLQAPIRQALLALGASLHTEGKLDDPALIFELPLPVARALAAGSPAPAELNAQARAGKALREAQRCNPPHLPREGLPGALRGFGTGGRASGTVHLHRAGGNTPPSDAILVATSILPTELPLLNVAALVVETGGPLDHVAAQARERGLPAVVGAEGACTRLRQGERVWVDADAGVVKSLEEVTPVPDPPR